MSSTIFHKVDYDLGTLIDDIELGEISLPNIQRPFVWKNAKVRDLFDSMYRGYPVGYLLLWNSNASNRSIGEGAKQKHPRLVIVDGQQRLTSLFSVIKGVPVVRENYKSERICIAFNPLEERFEVADAAVKRDKSFIPDITEVWKASSIIEVIDTYLERLKESREVSNEEEKNSKNAFMKLWSLLKFPLTALELQARASEEDVAEVFVRINSKGERLDQADFILTLMSVFWDSGRSELEDFCHDASKAPDGKPSPSNYFIKPSPDQLLRVSVGTAFKRARLRHVYSMLRGKDLETGEFNERSRGVQFDKLKNAQENVINLKHWHEFLKCIYMAGFRSSKTIISENNLLFSYVLYLIGLLEYKVSKTALRKAIAQWFFMAAITRRYTSSAESAMEFDLAKLRYVSDAEGFIVHLKQVCETSLTKDFWEVTLPDNLATSAPRSPSLFSYNASLVLLDAPALYSNMKISSLLDPAHYAPRSGIERHHLFPVDYLEDQGITDQPIVNQIANYAYIEWGDNADISNASPNDYVPILEQRFSKEKLSEMYRFHALPPKWEQMAYEDFLPKRRELMARITREGYETLISASTLSIESEVLDLESIADGESEVMEFKSTLRTNMHTGETDKRIEMAVLRTIAGFLNTGGGLLLIGISDDGTPVGVEADKFSSEDRMCLHLISLIKSKLGISATTSLHIHFDDYEDNRVLVVRCSKSSIPVYVKDGSDEKFFVRAGPSTAELPASQIHDYISKRFD